MPFWAAYGVLYGSACDSRWHECGHGTAFKTRWMNDVVYNIASFQVMRNPVAWRWSHARHHTDTYIVGRETVIPSRERDGLARWRKKVFAFMARNSERTAVYFGVPTAQAVELGLEIEL